MPSPRHPGESRDPVPFASSASYLDFRAALDTRAKLKPAIEANAGLTAREQAAQHAFEHWWKQHSPRIAALAAGDHFFHLRADLLKSFSGALDPLGMLDRFQVRGIVAGFWDGAKFDLLTLMARGAKGVVDAWRGSILTALEDDKAKANPLDHKLVRALLPDFIDKLAELEASKAELDGQIKAATPDKGEEEDEADESEAVDETQLKAWKKDLAAVKKRLKSERAAFAERLNAAVDALDEPGAMTLLLGILHDDMQAILDRYIAAQRRQVVAAFENWWDKYRVTLVEIERERDRAAGELRGYLKALGYG